MYEFLGIKNGKEAGFSIAFPETETIQYKLYKLSNGKEIGIPIKSSWTIEQYLKTHNQI